MEKALLQENSHELSPKESPVAFFNMILSILSVNHILNLQFLTTIII